MNLREAYLYINENKLKDFIKKRCNRITSIKFMLENTVYCEVLSDNPYCIDMLFGSIKGEIISRYITNKNFLTEVIKYLINRGVTLADVMDTFNEHFNTSDNAIKNEHENHDEVRKPITDLDLLLCGRSVEENSTPCEKVEEKAENSKKPVSKSRIDYPKNSKNHGNGVSPARKALFDVVGDKTVIEHLKENGITYTNFDNRIRKKWSVAEACTTPLASWGKGKRKRVIEEPEEPEESKAVIIPDNPDTIICLEPEKITGTKVKVVEESSTPEKATESVTNATELNGNNVTAVILDTPNPDAIHKDKDDNIEKALKKFVTHSDESKKPKETKSDLTVLEVCQKMNVTTHELKEMVNSGEFPQPDCDKKWSVKLLKKEGII